MPPLYNSVDLYVSSARRAPFLRLVIHPKLIEFSSCRSSLTPLLPLDVPEFSPLPCAAEALRQGYQDSNDVQRLARRARLSGPATVSAACFASPDACSTSECGTCCLTPCVSTLARYGSLLKQMTCLSGSTGRGRAIRHSSGMTTVLDGMLPSPRSFFLISHWFRRSLYCSP